MSTPKSVGDKNFDTSPDQVPSRIAEHPFDSPIDERDEASVVYDNHAIRGCLKQQPKLFLGLTII